MYLPPLRNCVTFFPSRAKRAQREAILGFCSSPRSICPSNANSLISVWRQSLIEGSKAVTVRRPEFSDSKDETIQIA
jgi:hypothetical protein